MSADGKAPGWIVAVTHRINRDGEWRTTSPGYWYGPDHGFGTTSGPFEENDRRPAYSVAVFTTRRAAEVAVRSVYGKVPAHMRAVRIADAAAAERARRAERDA